jgi:hypothetical protein
MNIDVKNHTEGNVALHHVLLPVPEGVWCDEVRDLSKYDARDLAGHGIVEAWYWYRAGSYEGTGELIGRGVDGRWTLLNLSHCSCYGPCDDSPGQWFSTLAELAAFPFEERRKGIKEILAAARYN